MVNALWSKAMASKDRKVDEKVLNAVVSHFVSQEKKIAEMRDPSTPT